MPQPVPTSSFDTEPDYAGIPRSQIFLAIILELPFLYLLSLFLSGIWFILAGGLLAYYIFLPIAEYFKNVVPPKIIPHTIEWIKAGRTLYITNDPEPMPLTVPDKRK